MGYRNRNKCPRSGISLIRRGRKWFGAARESWHSAAVLGLMGRTGRETARSCPEGVHCEMESSFPAAEANIKVFFSFRNTWDWYVKVAHGN